MPNSEYLFRINNIIKFHRKYLQTTYCDKVWAINLANKCSSLIKEK